MVERLNLQVKKAQGIRVSILKLAKEKFEVGAHLGSAFSLAEIFAVLPDYFDFNGADDLVLSKGHASLVLYSFLQDTQSAESISKFRAKLLGHPVKCPELGIEVSTGSLGIGFASAVGLALHKKLNKEPGTVVAILGDGECDEGIVYESARIASKYKLSNLLVILDVNGFQQTGFRSDISGVHSLEGLWQSLLWQTKNIDGHLLSDINDGLANFKGEKEETKYPVIMFASTVKGKGLLPFENTNESHHITLTPQKYDEIISALMEVT
jgi:transketolase